MSLAETLEAGKHEFLEAAGEVSAGQGQVGPGHRGWSAPECIEHVVAVEERYLIWMKDAAAEAPRRDAEREFRLFNLARSRLIKLEAPEAVRPRGRFRTFEEAIEEFQAARNRSIAWAREKGVALYSIGVRHPRFGLLSGAEVVKLMDAHARRHAEQMREIGMEVTRGKEKRVKQGKARKAGFRRDEPDLGEDMVPRREAGWWFSDGDFATIRDRRLQDLEAANLRAATLRVEGSVLERVQLAGGEFGAAVWKDARFVGCDLANVRAHRLTLVRVELIDCRMAGLRSEAAEWQDVLIRNGDGRFAQLQGGKFGSCEFDGCQWEEADLQRADLSGCVLRSSNLGRADLRGARLRDADLRGSEVEGIVVGAGDVQGAIVDAAQAMVFARLLGLRVR